MTLAVLHGWAQAWVVVPCLLLIGCVVGYFLWWCIEGWKHDG